jgi:hypothetical protein
MSFAGGSLRVWGILSVCLVLEGCDQAPGVLGKARASLDPIVGEWREVVESDTSDVMTVVFKSNRRFLLTTTIRNPGYLGIKRELVTFLDSIPATFARGDSVVVVSYDNRALASKGRAISAKYGESSLFNIDSVGTLDATFKCKLNGDILELTEERGPQFQYPAKTQRFIRVR